MCFCAVAETESYVADELITSRAGVRVRIGNTDAEGRMVMADVLCQMKERVTILLCNVVVSLTALVGDMQQINVVYNPHLFRASVDHFNNCFYYRTSVNLQLTFDELIISLRNLYLVSDMYHFCECTDFR